ncbi:MAG: NAD-dependent epimerase/dehydratase family protein [Candidatus Cloacimonadota bacterium]|nr:NAD-dependent epimerase/dehydratase family protein [Candidatus Cloacimonadota bacterium]
MKNIVITGANGFVGSALAKKLLNSGHEVTCLVRTGSDISLIEGNKYICYINYDNLEEIEHALQNKDILIHAAALTRARKWESFKKINIELTDTLLKISNNSSIKKFIFLSSQAVAGPALNESSRKKEEDSPNPITMYGKSKLLAEDIIHKNAKMPWTIIRPVSVYGAGDKDFLALFKMVKKHFVFLNSFRTKYYSIIYIDELTDLIEKTINNEEAYNETFFAANPRIIKNKELHKLIGEAINSKTITIRIPEFLIFPIASILEFFSLIFNRKFPVLNRDKVKEFKEDYWIVDTTKAKTKLNIEFKDEYLINFKKTYQWYKNKGWL